VRHVAARPTRIGMQVLTAAPPPLPHRCATWRLDRLGSACKCSPRRLHPFPTGARGARRPGRRRFYPRVL
jgi:hypothetical protein